MKRKPINIMKKKQSLIFIISNFDFLHVLLRMNYKYHEECSTYFAEEV